ncbi:DUF5131 family protein, partial [Candidatus Darwinibacter acetoxidans]
MNTTTIEWATHTWNPVTGCTPVSEGCENCYAKRMAQRLRGRYGYPEDEPFKVTRHDNRLLQPLKLRKPSRIFVCSMGDLFHEDVPNDYIDQVFGVMTHVSVEHHTFLILTKRPERMRRYISSLDCQDWGLPRGNIWLGVTVENNNNLWRIEELLQIPAAVRFVCCEPMLGPVDLRLGQHWLISVGGGYGKFHFLGHEHEAEEMRAHKARWEGAVAKKRWLPGIDWVICGGETGPGARPMHPDWVRLLRDQCQVAGVPFLFKQWGEWAPIHELRCGEPGIKGRRWFNFDPDTTVCKVGKKRSGRLLDG